MEKEKYIQQELSKLLQSFTELLFLVATFGILLLGILDYFATPENFNLFLVYRFIAASIYMTLFLVFRKIKKYPLIFIVLGTLTIAGMVELMILSFGGHQSTYYAGMIIVFMFLFGFLPISFKVSLFLTGLIYAIYLLPILALDKITNLRIFISNNIFLIAMLTGGLLWRYINYKIHIKKISLEYDLSKDKEQLETYSTQLEELVQERTKDLSMSEQRFRALFDNANDGVVVLDKNGIIINMNNKFCELPVKPYKKVTM